MDKPGGYEPSAARSTRAGDAVVVTINHRFIAFSAKAKYHDLKENKHRQKDPVRKENENGCILYVELFTRAARIPVTDR